MANLVNWSIVVLIIALIVIIAGVSIAGIPTQWLIIILIVIAIILILMGRHRRWLRL